MKATYPSERYTVDGRASGMAFVVDALTGKNVAVYDTPGLAKAEADRRNAAWDRD